MTVSLRYSKIGQRPCEDERCQHKAADHIEFLGESKQRWTACSVPDCPCEHYTRDGKRF